MALYKGAVDTTKTKNGVWKEFKEAEFLIGSMSATKLIRMRSDYIVDEELDQEKLAEAIVNHGILKDWKGIVDFETDNEVPFTKEGAVELLTEYEDLCTLIISVAQDEQQYLREKDMKKVEKVKKPSNGS